MALTLGNLSVDGSGVGPEAFLASFEIRFFLAEGTWCSGITSASHAEGPGFKSQCVHLQVSVWRASPDRWEDQAGPVGWARPSWWMLGRICQAGAVGFLGQAGERPDRAVENSRAGPVGGQACF